MLKAADTIVIGTIVNGTAVNRTATVTIQVEQTLRGELKTGSTISFEWTKPGGLLLYQPVPVAKGRGLFFFRQDARGNLTLLPPMNGDIDFEGTYYFIPPKGPVEEVKAEQAITLEEKIFAELAASKVHDRSPGQGAVFDLEEAFAGLHSSFITDTFNRFSVSNDARLKTIGLKARLRQGDLAALAEVRASVKDVANYTGAARVTEAIRFYFLNEEPAAVKILGELLVAEDASIELRNAAATALARLHSKEALPYLAKMLESPNITMRTYAVGGMAMFANNVPVGGHHPAPGDWKYRTEETIRHSALDERLVSENEAFYVGFWMDWWSQHRIDLSQ